MLNFVATLKAAVSHRSRKSRATLFLQTIRPTPDDLIVDLGGGRGHHIARYFPHLKNVIITDHSSKMLSYASDVATSRPRPAIVMQLADFLPLLRSHRQRHPPGPSSWLRNSPTQSRDTSKPHATQDCAGGSSPTCPTGSSGLGCTVRSTT